MILVFSLLFFLMAIIYARQFILFTRGWLSLDSIEIEEKGIGKAKFTYAVVIAFRNEVASLLSLYQEMMTQKGLDGVSWEFILVDDHSEDGGLALLQGLKLATNVRVYSLPEGKAGKKAAITFGIEKSRADYIICTDADTTRTPHWLRTMVAFIEQERPLFVSAPVFLNLVNARFFERWQQLEFSGLISIGGGAIAHHKPNMCNGANLAFKRVVFDELGGYEDNAHILSGDDEFLMHKIHRRYPGSVRFLKHQEAMVSTSVKTTLKSFLQQRMRWSSKATKYKSPRVIQLSVLVYLFTAGLPLLLLAGIFYQEFWLVLIVLLLIKGGVEHWFYKKTLPFYGIQISFVFFVIAELFQILYVSIIGVLGTFVSYQWKGRKG